MRIPATNRLQRLLLGLTLTKHSPLLHLLTPPSQLLPTRRLLSLVERLAQRLLPLRFLLLSYLLLRLNERGGVVVE